MSQVSWFLQFPQCNIIVIVCCVVVGVSDPLLDVVHPHVGVELQLPVPLPQHYQVLARRSVSTSAVTSCDHPVLADKGSSTEWLVSAWQGVEQGGLGVVTGLGEQGHPGVVILPSLPPTHHLPRGSPDTTVVGGVRGDHLVAGDLVVTTAVTSTVTTRVTITVTTSSSTLSYTTTCNLCRVSYV